MTAIILPVKSFARAKQRLASVLTPAQREQLSQAMLFDMLLAVDALPESVISSVVLVSDDSKVHEYVAGLLKQHEWLQLNNDNVIALLQNVGEGKATLNNALTQAMSFCQQTACNKAAILSCDLPLIDAHAIAHLLGQDSSESFVFAMDKTLSGTNAMVLPVNPHEGFSFQYGEQSLQKHYQQAAEQGLSATLLSLAPLMFDLDSPEDWKALLQQYRQLNASSADLLNSNASKTFAAVNAMLNE